LQPDRPGQRQRHLHGQHHATDHGHGGRHLHLDRPLQRRRQQPVGQQPTRQGRESSHRPSPPAAGSYRQPAEHPRHTRPHPRRAYGTSRAPAVAHAVLSTARRPARTTAFPYTAPFRPSYRQTDPVSGNGTYTASTTLPTTGMVAGTYTWTAHYSGDANNLSANDQGGTAEQTVVSPAQPTLVTDRKSVV